MTAHRHGMSGVQVAVVVSMMSVAACLGFFNSPGLPAHGQNGTSFNAPGPSNNAVTVISNYPRGTNSHLSSSVGTTTYNSGFDFGYPLPPTYTSLPSTSSSDGGSTSTSTITSSKIYTSTSTTTITTTTATTQPTTTTVTAQLTASASTIATTIVTTTITSTATSTVTSTATSTSTTTATSTSTSTSTQPTTTVTATSSDPKPLGYADFLYVYPSQGAATPAFANLISLKKAYPNVPMVAIVNDGNGGGTSTDPNYVSAINAMRAVGILVIGYVYCIETYGTTPGSRNMVGSDSTYGTYDNNRGLEQAIDAWGTNYKVDGIFFDNAVPGYPGGTNHLSYAAPGWPGHTLLQYYQQATAYAESTYGYTLVMDNVQTMFSPMIGVATSLTIEDMTGVLPTPAQLSSWTTGVGGTPANFNLIVYSQTTVPSVAYLSSIKGYVSYVYITDLSVPQGSGASFQNALLANLNQS